MHIPIFPHAFLLFPGARLSLHLYEPRYVRMLAAARAGDSLIGILWGGREVGAVGRIASATPKGERWLVVLEGQQRFRMGAAGASTHPDGYLVADVDTLDGDAGPDEEGCEELCAQLRRRVELYLRSSPETARYVERVHGGVEDGASPTRLSFWASAALILDPKEQQRMLETPGTPERLRKLLDLVPDASKLREGRQRADAVPPLTKLAARAAVAHDGPVEPGLPHELALALIDEARAAKALNGALLRRVSGCHLTALNLAGAKAVDDAALRDVVAEMPAVTELVMDRCFGVTDVGLGAVLARLGQQLVVLSIDKCRKVTDAGLAPHVAAMSEIEVLRVSGTRTSYRAVVGLSPGANPRLSELDVSCTDFNDAGAAIVAAMPSLVDLRMSTAGMALTDSGVAGLEGLTGLLRLDLALNAKVGDVAVRALAPALEALAHLDVSNSARVTDDAIEALADSRLAASLQTLIVDATSITDDCAAHLARLTGLETLRMARTEVGNGVVSAVARSLLAIDTLWVSYSSVTDAGLEALGQAVGLRELRAVGVVGISDASLPSLPASLEVLAIGSRGITNEGLEGLFRLRNLCDLRLFDTSVTQRGSASIVAGLGLRLDDSMLSTEGNYLFVGAGV